MESARDGFNPHCSMLLVTIGSTGVPRPSYKKTKAALCEYRWFLLGRGYSHGRGRQKKHREGHSLRNSFLLLYPAAAHRCCPWEWQDPQVMLPGVRGQGTIAPQSRCPALWLLGQSGGVPPGAFFPWGGWLLSSQKSQKTPMHLPSGRSTSCQRVRSSILGLSFCL